MAPHNKSNDTPLHTLRLRRGVVEDAVETAGRSPVATYLRDLRVWGTGGAGLTLGSGIGTLVSYDWPALEALRVDNCGISDTGSLILAADFAVKGRKSLHIGDALTTAGARSVAEVVLLHGPDSLSLTRNPDEREELRELP